MEYADESTIRMAEAPNAGDERLLLRFYLKPVKDDAKSLNEGRHIYSDQEYIEIVIPGDKDNSVNRPLRDEDRQRFQRQYAKWKSLGVNVTEGTPLEVWPLVSRAQVEELRFFNVTTVEALAGLADVHTAKFMGLLDLKKKAQAFLVASAGDAPAQKLQAELEKRDAEIAQLKKNQEDQASRIEQLLKARR